MCSRKKVKKTVLVLKTPKTESSVRKVFLPRTVAYELIEWKHEHYENAENAVRLLHESGV